MQVVLSLKGVARAIIAEIPVETEIEEVGTVVESGISLMPNSGAAGEY